MQESYKNSNKEIDFQDILMTLFNGRKMIIFITSFFSVAGIIYSLLLPNIYESKALLVPVEPSSGLASALGRYGSFAGLAGISLPDDSADNNSQKALEKLVSLSFFENNIMPNIFLPDLMAVKSWSYKTNKINYDIDLYNKDRNLWIRDYSYPQKQIPSAQESFQVFKKKHLTLSEDNRTGFISLSIKHQSPNISKEWVELIINEVNNVYRQKDKLESEMAIDYLQKQIIMTSLSEIKLVIAELMQEETKKLALVEANEYYVFDYIDPPAAMEKKSGPPRALICIFFILLGLMLSTLIVFIKQYAFRKNTTNI